MTAYSETPIADEVSADLAASSEPAVSGDASVETEPSAADTAESSASELDE